jgi:tetratricopeptide (TPR) repeat protein
MLSGLVAFVRGDWDRALEDLEEGVKLDPESVAARGMLAMACLGFGDWTRYAQITAEVEKLDPRTPEDYLFKGYAQRWASSERSLQNLDEAVRRTQSPLALAIRADALLIQAEGTDDLKVAEQAVSNVEAAKASLPDNACVLSISVWAHVVAANLYLEHGNPEKRRIALEDAKRDAQALKAWDTSSFPFEGLMLYYEQTGQEPACIELGHRAHEKSDAPIFAYKYALALYRDGQTDEALRALEKAKKKVLSVDALRPCILAELHPQDLSIARAACDEIVQRHGSAGEGSRTTLLLLLMDKREEKSENELQDFLKMGARSRSARHDTHVLIALKRLAEGDRAGAREHFRQAVETHMAFYYGTDLIRCILARMEKDPNSTARVR